VSDADVLPARINPYRHLMTRVDPKQLDALFETEKSRRRRRVVRGIVRSGIIRSGIVRRSARSARIDSPPAAHRMLRCWRMRRPSRQLDFHR